MLGIPVHHAIAAVFWGGFAFAFVLVHFYSEPFRWWRSYLRHMTGWGRIRDVFNATSLASYLLPFKLGLPLRLLLISRFTGMTRWSAAGLMALDSAMTVAAWTAVGLMLGGQVMLDKVKLSLTSLWLCIGAFVLVLLVVIWRGHFRKMSERFHALRAGIHENPRRMLLAFTLVVVDILGYGARHACIALASGAEPSLVLGWASWGIVATFAGMASGVPMGLVGYDATIALLAVAHGVPPAQIAWVIAINRVMSLAAAVMTGLPASRRLGLGRDFRTLASKLKEIVNGR